MLTAPSGDWSVFQRIFADHWEVFHLSARHPDGVRDVPDDLLLECGGAIECVHALRGPLSGHGKAWCNPQVTPGLSLTDCAERLCAFLLAGTA